MARDYDTQLLESVAVRRRRTRDALLFGARRSRRTLDENLGKLFASLAIAAVLCAGCVGWSFLQHQLLLQKRQEQRQNASFYPGSSGSSSATASPVPTTGGYGTPEPTRTRTTPHPGRRPHRDRGHHRPSR